ncbi:MAG: hypothetical protein K6F42_07230 [Bacteroidales bacterium]|nr:hypothetical protein [Bacteroidales bacterium]
MKKILKGMAFVALAAALACACKPDNNGDNAMSEEEKALKAVVEQYVPGVIYEIYGNLADETETLWKQLVALRDASSPSQADIDKACATFLEAREWWEKSEAFLFGAATTFGIDPHIDSWPLDKDKLALSLSNAEVIAHLAEEGAGAADELGAASLGFHGIEFILFRNGKNRTQAALQGVEDDEAFAGRTVTGKSELVFAAAVAEDLYNSCAQLQVSWDPDAPKARQDLIEALELNCTVEGSDMTFGENLLGAAAAGSTYATWQEAAAKSILSGSAAIADEVANTKIGTAHYVGSDGYDADYIESPYSQRSYVDFRDNILSIQYSLYGDTGATTPGQHSLMTFLGTYKYAGASQLQADLEAALKALQACIDSGVPFVVNPQAEVAGKAIVAVNKLCDDLGDAADWIVKL